jgi:hypothetical protein
MKSDQVITIRQVSGCLLDWFRFQAGIWETRDVLSGKGNIEVKAPVFHLLGYGPTEEIAMKMARRTKTCRHLETKTESPASSSPPPEAHPDGIMVLSTARKRSKRAGKGKSS